MVCLILFQGDNVMNAIKPTIKLFTSQEDDTTGIHINNLILEHNGNNYHFISQLCGKGIAVNAAVSSWITSGISCDLDANNKCTSCQHRDHNYIRYSFQNISIAR
jgi:hypothetical protein